MCDSKPVAVVNINSQPVKFRVDTGADVTVIPKSYLENFNVKLLKCGSSLIVPQNEALSTARKLLARMSVDNKARELEVFVNRLADTTFVRMARHKSLKTIQGLTGINIDHKYSQMFTGLDTTKCQ